MITQLEEEPDPGLSTSKATVKPQGCQQNQEVYFTPSHSPKISIRTKHERGFQSWELPSNMWGLKNHSSRGEAGFLVPLGFEGKPRSRVRPPPAAAVAACTAAPEEPYGLPVTQGQAARATIIPKAKDGFLCWNIPSLP